MNYVNGLKICPGNAEEDYLILADEREGLFKNKQGIIISQIIKTWMSVNSMLKCEYNCNYFSHACRSSHSKIGKWANEDNPSNRMCPPTWE